MSKQRKSMRLKDYDYSQEGAYFVTICSHQRKQLFGEIIDGKMIVNDWGAIIQAEWEQTAIVRSYVELDAFVVMPNHVHGIIIIVVDSSVGATRRVAPTKSTTLQPASLGAIIGQFKSIVTKRIRHDSDSPDYLIWQRNYHDHIIRNESDLNRIREYVLTNPARWKDDTFYE